MLIYLLFVMAPSLLIAMWAQAKVKSAYGRASKMKARSGSSGAEAAREILHYAGVEGVSIERTQGWLSDHYDPSRRVLRLSPDVYEGRSLASLGIAAHEAGHALQHARNYAPLALRNAIVPAASIGSYLSFILIIVGLVIGMTGLAWLGVGAFAAVVLFQFVNLPCEFNASARARALLTDHGLVTDTEDKEVKRVLDAAALTYVAALVGALLQLAYYALLVAGIRD